MRLYSALALASAFALVACAQSRQQQDMLAPHVGPAIPPQPLSSPALEPRIPEPNPPAAPARPASESAPASTPGSTTLVTPASGSAGTSLPVPQTPTAIPARLTPTGSRALLEPMSHEYETWNNCAPVTAEMVLSFYGIQKRQTEIAPVLRPFAQNFSVRMDQISAYLSGFGLQGGPRVGGTIDLVKRFVSNGVPVVVEDQLSLQDDYGHFRVVRGYDDAAGVLILGDSYFGPANRIPYTLYTELWKRHNYGFMPVYRPAASPIVQAILGRDSDPQQNIVSALAAARTAVSDHPTDGFNWLNLGADLYNLGQFEDAIAAWEQAKQLKLTARTLWYTIWPAAAYNHLGRYQQAIDVTATPLSTDPNNAEALLERGNAYRGLGSTERARADYMLAIQVDPSLQPARAALASL